MKCEESGDVQMQNRNNRTLKRTKKLRIYGLIFVLCILISCMLCACSISSKKSDKLGTDNNNVINSDSVKVNFINVGKGDCIIIRYGQYTYMIDTGYEETSDIVKEKLYEFGVKKINGMIITHFDKDHVGGAKDILKTYDVDNIYMPDYVGEGGKCEKFLSYLDKRNYWNKVNYVTEDMEISNGDLKFNILAPKETSYVLENDYSLITKLTFKEDSMLFAGDAEVVRIEEVLGNPLLDSDVFKVNYHGNLMYNSIQFIDEISPKYSIITSDTVADVSNSVVEELENVGSEYYFNCEGDIECVSDGTGNIQVNQN